MDPQELKPDWLGRGSVEASEIIIFSNQRDHKNGKSKRGKVRGWVDLTETVCYDEWYKYISKIRKTIKYIIYKATLKMTSPLALCC